MDIQDVVRMARSVWGESAILPFDDLERFAALVAAHEREICALIADEHAKLPWADERQRQTSDHIADGIRARR